MGNLDGGSVDAADFEGRDRTIDLARPLAAQNERGGGGREEGNRSADPERDRRATALGPADEPLTVAVQDERSDESFELAVEAADALAAFHHPYAYAED
jgi:hypothetical protein